jgi:hypothetical protein
MWSGTCEGSQNQDQCLRLFQSLFSSNSGVSQKWISMTHLFKSVTDDKQKRIQSMSLLQTCPHCSYIQSTYTAGEVVKSQNEDWIWQSTSLFSTTYTTRTMMTPPNTCSTWATTCKMNLQSLLTLPGYSRRIKRSEGDKGGVDGIYLVFDYMCLSDFLHLPLPSAPPP